MSTLSLFNHKLPKTITNNQIVTIKLHFMFKYSFVMTVYDRKMLIQSKRSVAEMNFIKFHLCHTPNLAPYFLLLLIIHG